MRLLNRRVYAQLETDRYWDSCEEQWWEENKEITV